MKPIEVNENYLQDIISSNSWERAGISVLTEEAEAIVEEATAEEATVEETTEEELESALDILEAVLAELSDEELLEHAANMLEVFDAASVELDKLEEEEEEGEGDEVVEEEVDEDIDNMSPALLRALLKSHREEA